MKLRRIILAMGMVVLGTHTAFAAGYGAAGCGLGSLAFGEKTGFVQVFAATTNGTSGNQTFGITSGTSNCLPKNQKQAQNMQEEFLRHNFATFAKESAQGQGESLEAFAATLGCSDQRAFNKLMQAKHNDIFSAAGETAVLNQVKQNLAKDSTLGQCQWI